MDTTRTTTDVLVVGAGPAGLVTATSLAHHGVRTLIIDRHPGTSPFPKATGVSTRTMEIVRGWGLEAAVLAGSSPASAGIAVAPALNQPPVAVRSFGYPSQDAARAVSPTAPASLPQDHLEPVLTDHLAAHGVAVRFRTELIALCPDDDGATAWLRDLASGAITVVRAAWVVGADGPTSGVRAAVGIDLEELGMLGDHVAVMFHAPLADVPPERWAGYAIESPAGSSLLIPAGRNDRWIYDREREGDVSGVTDERWIAEIRAAAGIADLPVRIQRAFQFTMTATVARRLRADRVFLVGDAAHRTTPVGGIGMNTAIQAAHNLGWKLAWVVRGWADEALLDTYEDERRPVGFAAAWRSMHPEIFDDFDGLATELGVRYRSAAVAADDPLVGGRAPHWWLAPGLSTLDLFDRRLTLVTGPVADGWRSAARTVADQIPLAVVALGIDVPDHGAQVVSDLGLGPDGAVLVRPDGHISWRVATAPVDERHALTGAVAATLGQRDPIASGV